MSFVEMPRLGRARRKTRPSLNGHSVGSKAAADYASKLNLQLKYSGRAFVLLYVCFTDVRVVSKRRASNAALQAAPRPSALNSFAIASLSNCKKHELQCAAEMHF